MATNKNNWWFDIYNIENEQLSEILKDLDIAHGERKITYACVAEWKYYENNSYVNMARIYIQFINRQLQSYVENLIQWEIDPVKLDVPLSKGMDENPKYKIFATKSMSARFWEIGEETELRTKGRLPEFKTSTTAKRSPRNEEKMQRKPKMQKKIEEDEDEEESVMEITNSNKKRNLENFKQSQEYRASFASKRLKAQGVRLHEQKQMNMEKNKETVEKSPISAQKRMSGRLSENKMEKLQIDVKKGIIGSRTKMDEKIGKEKEEDEEDLRAEVKDLKSQFGSMKSSIEYLVSEHMKSKEKNTETVVIKETKGEIHKDEQQTADNMKSGDDLSVEQEIEEEQ